MIDYFVSLSYKFIASLKAAKCLEKPEKELK